jgi:hypothetical protein
MREEKKEAKEMRREGGGGGGRGGKGEGRKGKKGKEEGIEEEIKRVEREGQGPKGWVHGAPTGLIRSCFGSMLISLIFLHSRLHTSLKILETHLFHHFFPPWSFSFSLRLIMVLTRLCTF